MGPTVILWNVIKRIILAKQKAEVQAWINDRLGNIFVYNEAAELNVNDVRRLVVLNSYSVKALLQSKNRPLIVSNSPLVEEMIVLRRTTASRIARDTDKKRFFSLRDFIKSHHMVTRILERTSDEEAEFQWMHRDAAQ